MIAAYILSSLVCLALYLFINWNEGQDLILEDLISMIFIASVPFFNVLVLLCLQVPAHVWPSYVILKGKKDESRD